MRDFKIFCRKHGHVGNAKIANLQVGDKIAFRPSPPFADGKKFAQKKYPKLFKRWIFLGKADVLNGEVVIIIPYVPKKYIRYLGFDCLEKFNDA